ncbi:MAG: phosphoribosylanthranilate isomerase [bacterium]|nr:phosphoribosylanthranilate isomerase [bacterium]
MNIKICGIQSIKDVTIAIHAGAHFVGLNFVRSSKRRISMERAQQIMQYVRSLSSPVQVVGVFQHQTYEYINMVAHQLDLDYVQLHGSESPKFVSCISKPVIKVFSLKSDFDVEKTAKTMKEYHAAYYLIDRMVQGKGDVLSPEKVSMLAKLVPFFLAGGLTPGNVGDIVTATKPYGVDVASGVETNGTIDKQKVYEFISVFK